MKSNKGITLIGLVATISVLLILSGVAAYSGSEAIRASKYTKFTTELKIMQSYVNNWYEELSPTGVIGSEYNTQFTTNITNKFENAPVSAINANLDSQARAVLDAIDDINYSDYYLLNSDALKALKIDGVDQDVLINIKKRKVVSYSGIEEKLGDMVYTIDNDEVYNVEYENKNSQVPVINDIEVVSLTNSSWKLIAKDVTYNGYTSFKKIKYKKQGDTTEKESLNNFFVVDSAGTYIVKVVDTAGNISEEKTVIVNV